MDASFYPCNQRPLDQASTKDRFKGHVVVVAGGASGIGFAAVHRFCSDGAQVALLDFNKSMGESAVQHLKAEGFGDHVKFYYVDATQKSLCCDVARQVAADNGGRINHLVNTVACFISKGLDVEPDDWRKSFDVNVAGYANMVQACFPHMPRDWSCSIVNLGSISGSRPQKQRWTYCATKGAIKSLTKCMALDLSKHKIRVNSVAPGWIWTPQQKNAAPDGSREKMLPMIAPFNMMQRDGETSEAAAVIVFLCSRDASYVTGSEMTVTGGYLAMGPERHGEGSSFKEL